MRCAFVLIVVISLSWSPAHVLLQKVPLGSQSQRPLGPLESSTSGDVESRIRRVGLFIGYEDILGAWMDVEAIGSALTRSVSLKSANKLLWNAILFCGIEAHNQGKNEEGYDVVSVNPSVIAGCNETFCLGGMVSFDQAGTRLDEWANTIDTLIVFGLKQRQTSKVCRKIRAQHTSSIVSCVLLPTEADLYPALRGVGTNLTCTLEGGTRSLEGIDEVWARGPTEERFLRQVIRSCNATNVSVVALPWSAPDMVVRHSLYGDEDLQFSKEKLHRETDSDHSDNRKMSAGMFDGNNGGAELAFMVVLSGSEPCEETALARACEAVLQANENTATLIPPRKNSEQQHAHSARLDIAVMEQHSAWAIAALTHPQTSSCSILSMNGKASVHKFSSLASLRVLLTRADMFLVPEVCRPAPGSLAVRALHAGLPVLALNTWPFNETITHMHDGLLVRSHEELSEAVHTCLSRGITNGMRTTLRARLTAPQPGLLSARQHAHALHVQYRLSRTRTSPPPRVLSMWPGPHELHRRTELFRSDALRRHGYDVREAAYSADLSALGIAHVEFVVAAKPRVHDIVRIRASTSAPVYVWTWDLIDYEGDPSRRTWFEEAAGMADAAFLNEFGRERMWLDGGAHVRYIGDGTVLVGERGTGRRPIHHVAADSGDEAVFVGSVNASNGSDTYRIDSLKALMHSGVQLTVYGPAHAWDQVGVRSEGDVWAGEAAGIEAAAKVVLSLSRSAPHSLALYHSDRLLRETAAGACVVANAFRWLDLLMPAHSVVAVSQEGGPADVVSAVRGLLDEPRRRTRMRVRAEAHTWRTHTWEDSVKTFLMFVGARHGEYTPPLGAAVSVERTDEGAGGGGWADCSGEVKGYYERVGWGMLREGDADQALVYFGYALETCPMRREFAKAASLAALHAGRVKMSVRLWLLGCRLEGGCTQQQHHVNQLKEVRNQQVNARALDVLRATAGGWVARQVEGVCLARETSAVCYTCAEILDYALGKLEGHALVDRV